MADNLLRTLSLLQHIPRHRKVTASQICALLKADGFSVTLRTVQRDLITLSRVLPLVSDEPSKPAGWKWAGEQGLDIPALDAPTALALVLADRYLEAVLPLAGRDRLAGQAERARQLLDRLSGTGLGGWTEKVRVLGRGPRLQAPEVDASASAVVYTALLEGRRVDALYQTLSEPVPRRFEVNPLGLVARDGVVYVVATLWDYDDVKQLALHRFRSAEGLSTACRTPAGFDLDGYIASGEFDYPEKPGRWIRLRLRIDQHTARHIDERRLGDDQRVSRPRAGRVTLTATVQDTLELRWWLLGFGAQMEVLAPASLRRDMATTVQAMADAYGLPVDAPREAGDSGA